MNKYIQNKFTIWQKIKISHNATFCYNFVLQQEFPIVIIESERTQQILNQYFCHVNNKWYYKIYSNYYRDYFWMPENCLENYE